MTLKERIEADQLKPFTEVKHVPYGDEQKECAGCTEKFYVDDMKQNGDYGFYYCDSCYWWGRLKNS